MMEYGCIVSDSRPLSSSMKKGARLRILKWYTVHITVYIINYMNYCWFPYGQLLIGEFQPAGPQEATLLQWNHPVSSPALDPSRCPLKFLKDPSSPLLLVIWFQTWLDYFPFHIWVVIPTPLTFICFKMGTLHKQPEYVLIFSSF